MCAPTRREQQRRATTRRHDSGRAGETNKKKGRKEKKDNSHAVGRDNYFYDGVVCARTWMHVHTGERA